MSTNEWGYIDNDDVTIIAVYYSGATFDEWYVEGRDDGDGYADALWSYDTKEDAVANAEGFREAYGFPVTARIVVFEPKPARRRFWRKSRA